MYNFENLRDKIEKENISVCKIYTLGDVMNNGFGIATLESFVDLIKEEKINRVFIYEHYDRIDNYLITEGIVEEKSRYLNIEFLQEILPQIELYNKEVENRDFDIPSFCVVVCFYQGKTFYVNLDNLALHELAEPEEVFKEICNQNEEKLKEINTKKKKEIEKLKEELREKVFSDNKFLLCTNKDLRMNYARKLFNEVLDEHFLPLKKYWTRNELGMLHHEAYCFFDMLWNEIKPKK